MHAFVNEAQQRVNLASQDKFPQQGHCPFGRVLNDAVPAAGEPFELHEVRRQRSSEIGLAFDRMHRVVLTADHQGRTPDPVKFREHVERVALAAGFGEPVQRDLRAVVPSC